ncbi:MAG TPA: VacJ family lipoprotein [Smithellaceae bacterium]|nr:VacJ family lipoprotein [Smithellaceae bacterium]
MKIFLILNAAYIFLFMGCAHTLSNYASTSVPLAESFKLKVALASSNTDKTISQATDKTTEMKKAGLDDDYDEDDEYGDYYDDSAEGEKARIADPIEPFNRAMYHFNDKLYFWALKPVAQGYKFFVPAVARISVRNFFTNLRFPARFVSCVLQGDFNGAAAEAGRFAINTVWGIGGLMDPSSGKELNLQKQDTDLGQTLGVYGVGHGFYIVWPIFGPSSPRDSVTLIGNLFLYPVSYIEPFYVSWGIWAYEEINSTSLRIGDYESLKDAAIDPYVAMRDAYAQYRMNKIKERKLKIEKTAPQGEGGSVVEQKKPIE